MRGLMMAGGHHTSNHLEPTPPCGLYWCLPVHEARIQGVTKNLHDQTYLTYEAFVETQSKNKMFRYRTHLTFFCLSVPLFCG